MKNGKTSKRQSTSNLMRTEKIVDNLKKLPDGWGGEMSKKPTLKAVKKIKKLLSTIEQSRMPWPNVSAVPNGGVVLTWMSLTRDILMTIDTDGDVQFVTSLKKLDETAEVVERLDSEGHVTDMKTIDYMMAWYCSDKAHSA